MAKIIAFKNMTHAQKEELLLAELHAYRTMQVEAEANDYHMSIMERLAPQRARIDRYLSCMENQGGTGGLVEIARELRKLEIEFVTKERSTTKRNYMLQQKYLGPIREAVDAKLDALGSPVIKPVDFH